jgi:uncharacterized membrane protein
MSRLRRQVDDLQGSMRALETRLAALGKRVVGERASPLSAAGEPEASAASLPLAESKASQPEDAAPQSAVAPPVQVTAAAAVPATATPGVREAPGLVEPTPTAEAESHQHFDQDAAPPPIPRPTPAPSNTDFVGSLGPKILVGTGALAFVVFLGLFVKYAWENEWVGPWGRVLSGATLSLLLVAAGLRLLGREYRPLGQGLAATGFAGLYLAGYGAHAFYGLIPRGLAGLLMVVVTASAVALAVRLDTRLLATLAWLGAYLTPLLLSTGQDQALSLYAYLLLLAVGALVFDRVKVWSETAPIAFVGTMLLYAGWYGRHYRAERFETAALGLVLFTAVFGGALALRQRPWLSAVVGASAAFWITLMAADQGRAEWLVAMSLGVAFAWARQSPRLGLGAGLAALVAWSLPYLAWVGSRRPFDPEMLGLASLWLVGGVIAFVWPDSEETRVTAVLPALGLSFAGFAAVGLAADVDRPLGLLVLLLALAGLAVVLRPRVSPSEPIGALSGALAVAAWFDRFYRADRGGEGLLLGVALGLAYLLALAGRTLLGSGSLGKAGLGAHLVVASLLFGVLQRVFGPTSAGVLASTLLALAVLYGVLGLASLRVRGDDRLASGTAFGLGIGFLTLAIPVWLGLHAITLAWALEGGLLLVLGARHRSPGVRLAGYTVTGLAVIRLLEYHLPLHDRTFVPLLNPDFGTWLVVIASLGVSHRLTRSVARDAALDRALRPVLAAGALALLFVATTAETQDVCAQWARAAEVEGRLEAARFARRAAGLGLSVLWTLFATGLLAGGLAAKSRALYYSAYALFAFTAMKVVFVDLATYPTLLRMFSFLALAVLLMAGAYLNLRFKARLVPPEAPR